MADNPPSLTFVIDDPRYELTVKIKDPRLVQEYGLNSQELTTRLQSKMADLMSEMYLNSEERGIVDQLNLRHLEEKQTLIKLLFQRDSRY